MIVINNVDDKQFSFNDINYYKNFTPLVPTNSDKVRIVNTYDSSIELTDSPALFSDVIVDGVTYANVSDLQIALLPVVYTRDSLGGGGNFIPLTGTEVGNPVTGTLESTILNTLVTKSIMNIGSSDNLDLENDDNACFLSTNLNSDYNSISLSSVNVQNQAYSYIYARTNKITKESSVVVGTENYPDVSKQMGLIGVSDYSENYTDLSFVQKKYLVDNFPKYGTTAPASATATGTIGEIRLTSTYIYTCHATNQWRRVAVSTW